MSTVTLVGAFGQGNPGDEALCAAFCEALAEHDVIVVSGDPGDTARRHRVRAVPATALTHGRAPRSRPTPSSSAAARSSSRCTPRPVGAPNALLRNTVGARRRRAGPRHQGRDGRRRRRRPARPRRPRRSPAGSCATVDLLVLRDEESAAVLAVAGAPAPFWIGADPAWLLGARRRPTVESFPGREPTIVVALSHLAGDARFARATWPPRSRRSRDRYSVHLQPWQIGAGGRDLELAEQLRDAPRRRRQGARRHRPASAPRSATFVGADLVVGLRFHALVAAGDGRHPVRRRRPRAQARRARPAARPGVRAGARHVRGARRRHRATPSAHPPVAAAAVAGRGRRRRAHVRPAASCCSSGGVAEDPEQLAGARRCPTGRALVSDDRPSHVGRRAGARRTVDVARPIAPAARP